MRVLNKKCCSSFYVKGLSKVIAVEVERGSEKESTATAKFGSRGADLKAIARLAGEINQPNGQTNNAPAEDDGLQDLKVNNAAAPKVV